MTVTHISTATILLEIDGLRIMTDPVLDPAGSTYQIGKTGLARYTNEMGPAIARSELGGVDVVLLSHDQHRDNLDHAGRELVKETPLTLTTLEGAARLSRIVGDRAVGLRPFDSHILITPGGMELTVTGVPARHGPRGTEWITGTVTGFVLEWEGQDRAVYITGDTRLFRGLDLIAKRFDIGTCFLHAGGGCFGATGPMRYSMDGPEAVRALDRLDPKRVVPIHYDGWSHFSDTPGELRRALAKSQHEVLWLEKGAATKVPA